MTAINSRSFTVNSIFEFLNGKEYTLNGIHGYFKHDVWVGRQRTTEYLRHIPSKRGMATEIYKQEKRKLGDDWSTDLTNGLRYCDIAIELGCVYAEDLEGE